MKLLIYQPSTGEILRVVECPEVMALMQAQPGEAFVAGEGSEMTHFISGGLIVPYSPAQAALKAARPPWVDAAWLNSAMEWVDLRSMAQRKHQAREAMKAARQAAIDAPLATPYGVFDSDKAGRDNIADAVAGMREAVGLGQPDQIDWTLHDNTVATLTLQQLTHVALLLMSKVQAAHHAGRTIQAEIDAAQTPSEIESVASSIASAFA